MFAPVLNIEGETGGKDFDSSPEDQGELILETLKDGDDLGYAHNSDTNSDGEGDKKPQSQGVDHQVIPRQTPARIEHRRSNEGLSVSVNQWRSDGVVQDFNQVNTH